MHEFSICERLVATALGDFEKLGPPPPRLTKVRVVVGRLQQIVPESLEMAFTVITRDTPIAGASLEIVSVPVRISCADCGWNGQIQEGIFQCPECGSLGVTVEAGRELYLDSLEIEDRE